MRRLAGVIGLLGLAACQEEIHPKPPTPVSPPVASADSIPEAPLSGSIRGVPFKLGDARVLVDRRINYAHTDIKLSAGSAADACGPIKTKNPTSVWLRLDGAASVEPGEIHLEPGKPAGGWSVHYQVRQGERWTGNADGAAILRIRTANPDGTVVGDLAVCFGDGEKSCVSGTFSAPRCTVSLDEAVRGTLPIEAPPPPKGSASRPTEPLPSAVPPTDAGAAKGGLPTNL